MILKRNIIHIGLALTCLLGSYCAMAANIFIPLHDEALVKRIDKLLVQVGQPSMRKPYSVNAINALLPQIKITRPRLYSEISQLMTRYEKTNGLSFASITLAGGNISNKGSGLVSIPNSRGEAFDSLSTVFFTGHAHLNSWVSVTGGGQWIENAQTDINGTTDSTWFPVGSLVSIGSDAFQVDIGYKERWLSPMQHSAMLLSTNSPTSLSVGISNPKAYDFLGIEYDVFVTRLNGHSRIRFNDSFEPGKPYLLGTQFSISPIEGVRIAATRTMQFGGGSRKVSLGTIWDAFIDPVSNDNTGRVEGCASANLNDCELGNQLAALSTTMHFPGKVPFSVYFEYAGEDTAGHSIGRLGNLAASGGIYIPFIPQVMGVKNASFNYEVTQWQDAWYTHSIYRDGYTNDGNILGHWGAEQRIFNDGIGAVNHTLAMDTQLSAFKHLELVVNYLKNASNIYNDAYRLDLNYTHNRNWKIKFSQGKGTLDESFWRGALVWTW